MTLIEALRCSASVPEKGHSCEGCKYRYLEPVDPKFPCPSDVTIDGIEYWETCDTEQMALDAADELEHLANLKETIKTIHDNVAKEQYNKGFRDGQKKN